MVFGFWLLVFGKKHYDANTAFALNWFNDLPPMDSAD